MQKLAFIILLFLGSFYLLNCKSNSNEINETSTTKKDSVETSNLNNTSSPIKPPNEDYTGDYVDRYPNGIIKFTGFFRFGKRHGQWLAFYDNGIKWSECFYDEGKKQGQSIVYFPNGNVQFTGWYKQDLQDSLWFFYDINKNEVDRRAFKKGQETGLVN